MEPMVPEQEETNPIIAALEQARAALDQIEAAQVEKRKGPAAPPVEVEVKPEME